MDKGAARSRKRTNPQVRSETSAPKAIHASQSTKAIPPTTPQSGPSRPARPASVHKSRSIREPQSRDPALYRAKAVRSSAALIYSEDAFPLPPPKDILKGVRRIDLAGSGVKDIDWLKDCEEVTWLNLAGCEGLSGWEGVGHLEKLSVLNISNCGLQEIPPSLSRLSNLKALVAMGNPWIFINPEVIGSWKELNSLIVSHSPNLSSLPTTLSASYHLSKLTFSHCPSIKAESLPDLSPLPLLRDVKMNNLPYLSTLPPHISAWGTGDLSLVKSTEESSSVIKRGDGLEVLDLGNCSLTDTALSIFISPSQPIPNTSKSKSKKTTTSPRWPHLRSLSLHSNPVASTTPDYSTLLQANSDLPSLQIIDARRVVERKRKGEMVVSKGERRANERKEKRVKPSGANVGGMGKVRAWGGEEVIKGGVDVDRAEKVQRGEEGSERKEKVKETEKKEKKRKRHHEDVPVDQASLVPSKASRVKGQVEEAAVTRPDVSTDDRASKRPKSNSSGQPSQPVPVDPSTLPAQTKHKPTKSETAVVQVIDVAKDVAGKKGKKDKRGEGGAGGKSLDLKAVFGKKIDDEGTGLGVGGW